MSSSTRPSSKSASCCSSTSRRPTRSRPTEARGVTSKVDFFRGQLTQLGSLGKAHHAVVTLPLSSNGLAASPADVISADVIGATTRLGRSRTGVWHKAGAARAGQGRFAPPAPSLRRTASLARIWHAAHPLTCLLRAHRRRSAAAARAGVKKHKFTSCSRGRR